MFYYRARQIIAFDACAGHSTRREVGESNDIAAAVGDAEQHTPIPAVQARTMLACFAEGNDRAFCGELWDLSSGCRRPFGELASLLLDLDRLLDEPVDGGPKGGMIDALSRRHKMLYVVPIHVRSRQHASVQGTATLPHAGAVSFRSGLELLRLLDGMVTYRTTRRVKFRR